VFWILHVAVGSLIPLALFASRSKALWALGAFLAAVGFAAARMCVLIPGQIHGQIPGLQQAFQDPRLVYSYHPTSMEYLVGLFMVAVGIAIFCAGLRLNDTLSSGSKRRARGES
jgi:Ni/Fe-hydrogenase subunit HybB-like protein